MCKKSTRKARFSLFVRIEDSCSGVILRWHVGRSEQLQAKSKHAEGGVMFFVFRCRIPVSGKVEMIYLSHFLSFLVGAYSHFVTSKKASWPFAFMSRISAFSWRLSLILASTTSITVYLAYVNDYTITTYVHIFVTCLFWYVSLESKTEWMNMNHFIHLQAAFRASGVPADDMNTQCPARVI